MDTKLGFKAFYSGKKPLEITTAKSLYEAQCMAGKLWNLKPSHWHKIAVVLCEKDGEQVTHTAVD